jgi:F-type H+-transporting ATPase subunit epsilon
MAEATDKIRLEIVTPKGLALAATVDEVTAPSVDGEFGVMPGHLPLLAAVRTGLVAYKQGADVKRCAVGSGFAEAGPHKLLILTDEYTTRDEIDPVIVRKELAEVETELEKLIAKSDGGESEQRKVLIERENWLAAQLELYGDAPPPTMRPFEEYGPPAAPDVEEEDAEHPAGEVK